MYQAIKKEELRLENILYESCESNDELNTVFLFLDRAINSGLECEGPTVLVLDDKHNYIKKIMVQVKDLKSTTQFKKKKLIFLERCLSLDYIGTLENLGEAISNIFLYANKKNIKLSEETFLLVKNNVHDIFEIKVYKECV